MAKAKAPANAPFFDVVQNENDGSWNVVSDGEVMANSASRIEAAALAAELAAEVGGTSKGVNIYHVVPNENNDWSVVFDGKELFTSPSRVVAVDTAIELAENNNGTVND